MPSHGKSPPASKHSSTQLTLDQDDLTAQVARVLVEMQRQVPVTRKVQRTVEVPLAQYIDSRVEVPVVKEHQIPTTPTEQKTVMVFSVSVLSSSCKRARFFAAPDPIDPKGANHDRDPTGIHYFWNIAAPNARTLVLVRRFSSCQ